MNEIDKDKSLVREFKLTNFSLNNRSTVFLVIISLVLFGVIAYRTMSVETFPEVKFAYIFVKTVYPGNSPVDIENLITRPLEKEIQSINGIKVMSSTSSQDNSDIFVEFNTGVDIKKALQDMKDAVDQAKSELPDDLNMDPLVMELDFNEFPILNINISGDYSLEELKDFAEYLEEEIEDISEISKVELQGLNDREIQINIDPLKLAAYSLGFWDIENAINAENISMAGGDLNVDQTTRSVRVTGEFTGIEEIKNIIVKHEKGNIVYLKDIAQVLDGYADPQSFARLDGKPVVSLQVVKKSGENLLNATEKIFKILSDGQKNGTIPKELKISLTNDQSEYVRAMIDNLENTIITGMIFVVGVLFFFLGFRNAAFVGMAIPLSMCISFVVLDLMGSTINMMVLFAMVLALGMLVDNAIVVVENIFRFSGSGYSLFEAIKQAVGEIAMPIIASTATTCAAFLPLAFWPGIMGEFMKHLPITLIIVLSASLFVALVINPVLAYKFFPKENTDNAPEKKKTFKKLGVLISLAICFYLIKLPAAGTFLILIALLICCNYLFLYRASQWFQRVLLPKLENFYLHLVESSLQGKRPVKILGSVTLATLLVFGLLAVRKPKVDLFPINEPSFINIKAELPVGTDIHATNEFLGQLEADVFRILEPYKVVVESVLTNVGKGARGENEFSAGNNPDKGLITVSFVDYEDRLGINTAEIMKEISQKLVGHYPGVQISVRKNTMGPPTGRPINLEIIGKKFERLIEIADDVQQLIESKNIAGIEGLKMDLEIGKPELLITIDRERARRFGMSTVQIAATIRTALFGKDISDFKEGEDKFPIMLRLDKAYRNDISVLINQTITFRNNEGKLIQVPISAVASFKYGTTYGEIKRKDMDKAVTLYSNVLEGYNTSSINAQLKEIMKEFQMPEGYKYKFTGEQEDQEESMAFLIKALLIAVFLILIILVTQFNSIVKPFIILTTVFFSTIGVLAGLVAFNMDFVIIMTGVGIISLAGIVVNNAIVLIDYIDYLKNNLRRKLGIAMGQCLTLDQSRDCIVQAGKTRLRPVLLTAITTLLGLLPMAVAMNINFTTFLQKWNPQIYFGGDNADFWGPMAWAVIFGLFFSTFLTLILVPVIYYKGNQIKLYFIEKRRKAKPGIECQE